MSGGPPLGVTGIKPVSGEAARRADSMMAPVTTSLEFGFTINSFMRLILLSRCLARTPPTPAPREGRGRNSDPPPPPHARFPPPRGGEGQGGGGGLVRQNMISPPQ